MRARHLLPPWRDWMAAPQRPPVVTFPLRFGDLVVRGAKRTTWSHDEMTLLVADEHGPRQIDLQRVEGVWTVVGVWDDRRRRRLALNLTRAQRGSLLALAGILTKVEALRYERAYLVREAREDLWLAGAVRA